MPDHTPICTTDTTPTDRTHKHHAEATALEGCLTLPLVQQIYPQAFVKIPEVGGYLAQQHPGFRLEGAISFQSAQTQVAGNRDVKPGQGWTTVTTSVIEGLNIMDVLTADRVVAQISTEHPLDGYIPTVSFLGTRFENLRIDGHLIDIQVEPNILGKKPLGDSSYTRDPDFLKLVADQYRNINSQPDVPPEISARYNQIPPSSTDSESIECSLVHNAGCRHPIRGFGHVINVPNFGMIHLATLRVEHSYAKPPTECKPAQTPKTTFHLKMVEAHLGCMIAGKAVAGYNVVNGTTNP